MRADAARVVRLYAWSRIGIGGALTVAPGMATPWLADTSSSGVIRLVGVRDMVLGAAALVDPAAPSWRRTMLFCAVADAADVVVAVRRARIGHRRAAVAAIAAVAGCVVGLVSAVRRPTTDGDQPWRRSAN